MSAWEQVQQSATVMCKSTVDETVYSSCFAGKGDLTYLQWLLQAWGWTLTVALVALVIALVLGLVIGVMRTLPNKAVVAFGEAWTEFFRNIPILIQLLIWYHLVPDMRRAPRGGFCDCASLRAE